MELLPEVKTLWETKTFNQWPVGETKIDPHSRKHQPGYRRGHFGISYRHEGRGPCRSGSGKQGLQDLEGCSPS